MKKKQRDLINLLVQSRQLFKTSTDLAAALSLSDRTVRTYLQDLKALLHKNGAELVAKQGCGYQLQIVDRNQFNLFFHSNELKNKSREVSNRQHYLLNLLLLEEQKIDIETLSEQIFISTSQLAKDIAEIKNQLLPYDLAVKKEKSFIYVDGAERAKRHFIMSYFFNKNSVACLQELTSSTHLTEAISFEMLTIIILDECREAKLKLSDVMIQNIVLHLALSIKRIQSGLSVQSLNLALSSAFEFQIAKRIIDRIESIIGFAFPKEEQSYLALHLMTKSNIEQKDLDLELSKELDDLFIKIQTETDYLFLNDEPLKNGLIQHLKPMLTRLEQKIKLKNPLLEEIKTNYPEEFKLTKTFCLQLLQLAPFQISDDEYAYLTLHFLASIEKQKKNQKLQVLIICATGIGSAQLLKNRVENEFGKRIHIVATKGYYELESHLLDKVDFIISSIDLSSKVFKIPVLQVSVFLTEQDTLKIRQHLCERKNNASPHIEKTMKSSYPIDKIMNELCGDYFFYCNQKQPSQAFILEQLLDRLSLNEAPNYKKEMQQQIERRAQLGEIVFSQSIVVPHPAVPAGKSSKVGIALIPEGLFWSLDYPKIHFVFLISPSMYANPDLTMITKAIVDLIEQSETQSQMLLCQSFIEFKPLFLKLIDKGA